MRLVLDACVLYPTVLRALLSNVARAGLIDPVWSPRILEEWRRAAVRNGEPDDLVRGEVAALEALHPDASVEPGDVDAWLPDPDDVHVLAAGIRAGADGILTFNLKDFPTRVLGQHGLIRRDPDGLLAELLDEDPEATMASAGLVLARANAMGRGWTARDLFRKARLPRFAKGIAARVDEGGRAFGLRGRP